MSRLSELRERVESASGGDRELDADLFWMLDHERAQRWFSHGATGRPKQYPISLPIPPGLGRASVVASAPKYTASIDVALALVERMLPDAWWLINSGIKAHRQQGGYAYSCRLGIKDWEDFEGHGKTAPLAILEALLRALEQKEQDGNG